MRNQPNEKKGFRGLSEGSEIPLIKDRLVHKFGPDKSGISGGGAAAVRKECFRQIVSLPIQTVRGGRKITSSSRERR